MVNFLKQCSIWLCIANHFSVCEKLLITYLGVMYIKMLIKKVKLQKVGNCFGNLALRNIHFQFLNFTCQKNRDVQEIHRDMRGLETI